MTSDSNSQLIFLIVLSLIMISMGIYSMVTAFELKIELEQIDMTNLEVAEPITTEIDVNATETNLEVAEPITTEIDVNATETNLDTTSSKIKEDYESKSTEFLIEFGFGIFMIPIGTKILLSTIFNLIYKKVRDNKERKLAFFQTQFGFGLLVIAILISFSIQSMNDDGYDWMYLWSILAMIGIIILIIYREKSLHEIFDKDYKSESSGD